MSNVEPSVSPMERLPNKKETKSCNDTLLNNETSGLDASFTYSSEKESNPVFQSAYNEEASNSSQKNQPVIPPKKESKVSQLTGKIYKKLEKKNSISIDFVRTSSTHTLPMLNFLTRSDSTSAKPEMEPDSKNLEDSSAQPAPVKLSHTCNNLEKNSTSSASSQFVSNSHLPTAIRRSVSRPSKFYEHSNKNFNISTTSQNEKKTCTSNLKINLDPSVKQVLQLDINSDVLNLPCQDFLTVRNVIEICLKKLEKMSDLLELRKFEV